jgi:hypothetical protein
MSFNQKTIVDMPEVVGDLYRTVPDNRGRITTRPETKDG